MQRTGDRSQESEVRSQKSEGGTSGFTLIEIIITMVVLSIAAIGVLTVFTTGIKGSAEPLIVDQATQLAQQIMEQKVIGLTLSNGYNAVQDIASTPFAAPFANYSYTVNATCVDSNFANAQGAPGYNADGSCDQTFVRNSKLVTVTVTWTGGSVVLTTVVGNY
jgi:prepilin-type N-terminal cleavage/methylation domain-containing protein